MFQNTVTSKLLEIGVNVGKIEKEGELSLVYHIDDNSRAIIENRKTELEESLDAMIAISDMFGMQVAIIESNKLDE